MGVEASKTSKLSRKPHLLATVRAQELSPRVACVVQDPMAWAIDHAVGSSASRRASKKVSAVISSSILLMFDNSAAAKRVH